MSGQLVDRDPTVRSAWAWSFAQTVTVKGIGLATYFLLVRVVPIGAIGAITLATSIIGFAQTGVLQSFLTSGLRNFDERSLRTAHLFSYCISGGCVVASVAVAPALATAFHRADLQWIFPVVTIALVAQSIGLRAEIALKGSLAMRPVAIAAIRASSVSACVAIILYLLHLGVVALAVQPSLVLLLISVQLRLALRRIDTPIPTVPGSFVRDALHIGAGSLLWTISQQTDNILVGTVLGTSVLGVYAVGYKITYLGTDLFSATAVPVLISRARALTGEPRRLLEAHEGLGRWLRWLIVGYYGSLALFSPEIARAALPAFPVDLSGALRVLALFGVASSLTSLDMPILTGAGNVRAIPIINGLRAVATILLVPTFAAFWGLLGACTAVVIAEYVQWPVRCLFLAKSFQASYTHYALRSFSLALGLASIVGSLGYMSEHLDVRYRAMIECAVCLSLIIRLGLRRGRHDAAAGRHRV